MPVERRKEQQQRRLKRLFQAMDRQQEGVLTRDCVHSIIDRCFGVRARVGTVALNRVNAAIRRKPRQAYGSGGWQT